MGHDIDAKHLGASVFGVLLIALCLRLWGIGFALPYDLTADEPHHIVQALKIGAGDGGPILRIWHTVGKGGLDYLLFFEYGVLYVVWRLTGHIDGPDDFAIRYLQDPTAFYLLGRLTIALLGALTCVAVYWVGRRMFGGSVGLLAAIIGATAYFHGAQSHFINVHVAMACALWTGVGCYLEYERRRRMRWAIAAGFLIGTATALAYTAAIGLLLVGLALVARPSSMGDRSRPMPVLVGGGLSFLAAIAMMSPDLLLGVGRLVANFTRDQSAGGGELRESIDAVTILRARDWWAYLQILAKPINLLLSAGTLVGAAVGIQHRDRWSRILASVIVVFLVVVSAADRSPAERYLLPITPAMWLLCSYAIHRCTANRPRLRWAALAAVVALPLWNLIGQDFIWTRPDTRIVAKQWIEKHVPLDSKILVDGSRFRFVQGPPLAPNDVALERRLSGAGDSELTLSSRMLSLYATAQKNISGPKYDLYSTVYGLEVAELDDYVDACFDYVVTSSLNQSRYLGEDARRRFPTSARFYDEIQRDARFERVYRVGPEPWRRGGPTITVYRVSSACRQGP